MYIAINKQLNIKVQNNQQIILKRIGRNPDLQFIMNLNIERVLSDITRSMRIMTLK